MYGRIRSWILDDGEDPVPMFRDQPLLRKVENVRMLDRYSARKPSFGTLYLTTTHLIFVDHDAKKETWVAHMHIAVVEKLPLSTSGSPLRIRCKTFLSVTFVLPKERDCHEVFVTLQQLSQPVHIEDLYCFSYKPSNDDVPKGAGWNFFDFQTEFQRMRVPNDAWSLTLLNKDYELCDTYPRYLYVPSMASTTVLLGSSRFRSKGRLPTLTYLHSNKAAICRCSQPLSGFSARCLEDEQMLNCVLETNPNSKFMYVVDTRPKINAMANRAAGKGYENENFYENIKFHFLGIENIHTMRSSLAKMIETCELKSPSMNAFIGGLESSGWLRHVKAVLDTSKFIAQAVGVEGVTVLVHCSDGWDRTAQVCTLAALLLDPYYRTIHGFQAIIEKDWLSFGHKFTDRLGFIRGTDNRELSPVFTQLVDCVWQLLSQVPSAFQFNEWFLLELHDHAHSCQYGTFIGNCEKDRLDLRLSERTYSLWGYMANHMNEYINPLYKPDAHPDILIPNLAPQNIRFWRGMYCRFEGGVHPRESLVDLLMATSDHSSSLQDHIRFLQRRISMLKEKLVKVRGIRESDEDVKAAEQLKDGSLVGTESGIIDNKYLYEKKNLTEEPGIVDKHISQVSEDGADLRDAAYPSIVSSAHGLSLDVSPANITVEQLVREMESVALDWKTLRNVKECACSAPFDHSSRKYHCWCCGEVFCIRCVDKHAQLPGHLSQRAVPVCRPCFQLVKRALTAETP
ncbi:myotubularin-related protein 6 isoform X1 [Ischnura elegans]|uniref:myotubularin-related protein 6 isoform X1 n=1 Tax=Ischnura elegans TaxID=197161 RepID=UPI001ED87D87|nr:myotubularin-related protein 6 isoform X1 [Ischnura elegans]